MKLFLKILFIIILSYSSCVYASNNLKFINLDKLVQETNLGKIMLDKINTLDKKNIDKLKLFEANLKKLENDIKDKKNIISNSEFENEINLLELKIKEYNKEKNTMVKNLNNFKNKELKIFFQKINPIIRNYMKKNSIEIIFDNKNIFMGNQNSDLTLPLVNAINNNT